MKTTTMTKTKTLLWFGLFAVIRVLNVVLLIQSQFDPDEYWQNLEPSYCLVFWEEQLNHPHPHHPDQRSSYGKNNVNGGKNGHNNHDQHISIDDEIYHSTCPGWTWEWKRRWSPSLSDNTVTAGGNGSTIASSADNDSISAWYSLNFNETSYEQAIWGPVRSFASIIPTLVLYWILKRMGWDTRWTISKGPLIVNAILVAAVTDTCVWYASRWMDDSDNNLNNGKREGEEDDVRNKSSGKESTNGSVPGYIDDDKDRSVSTQPGWSVSFWCTYCTLSSWFNGYTMVRTYSNSIETVLLTLSLILVGPELFTSKQTTTSSWSTSRACLSFFLGGICSAIRFTCLAAYIPMGLLLALQQWSMSRKIMYVFGVCAMFGLMGLASTLVLDRMVYGFWAIPVVGNFHFNVIQDFGRLYGVHSVHWYLTAGIPAMTGMLLPVLIYDFFSVATWTLPRSRLWVIISYYIMALSLSDHKEFRFVLPILPMMCLISGSRLQKMTVPVKSWSKLRFGVGLGAFINLVVVLYLGVLHQRAPIDVNRSIVTTLEGRNETLHVSNSKQNARRIYRVHYLMGCHSTPLLSHLHSPGVEFEPWYLDCSPDCRSNPDVECESDAFSRDPRAFVERAYGFPNDTPEECLVDGAETCEAHLQALASSTATPDFIVCYSKDLRALRDVLELLGMVESERFFHSIDGIQVADQATVGNKESFTNPELRKWNLIQNSTALVISLEDMILFEKKQGK